MRRPETQLRGFCGPHVPSIGPSPALFSASTTDSAVWLSEPPCSTSVECTRIDTSCCAGSPYDCTTALAPPPGSEARTRSRSGGCSKRTRTIVPPENSTPFGIPLVQMKNRPARMITHDSPIACHFQRTKSKFGFLKICIAVSVCVRMYPCLSVA